MNAIVPEQPNFSVEVVRSATETRLVLAGELDIASADEFAEAARAELERSSILVDMRTLSFIDSSGVRVFNTLLGDAERAGTELVVRSEMQDNVRQVLEMTGMAKLLSFRAADGAGS